MEILRIENVSRVFGGIVAVADASLSIYKGQFVGIIGPNGAGKTTLFNCITGMYGLSHGNITLRVNGEFKQIGNVSPSKIAQYGIARTFQNIRLFEEMTVLDNIKTAMYHQYRYGVFSTFFRTKKFKRNESLIHKRAKLWLDEVGLLDKRDILASQLSYGEQRRIEIARALATGAKMLFLDEPAAGMNEQETNNLINFIRDIHKKYDLTIVLIEHDMRLVMGLCDHIVVLDRGICIAAGTPKQIQSNPSVIAAYLGEEVNDVKD
ncbi:MAG: ABC transporter ATP-binding protein [Erysipelothrix sp.]|jgi:branched-chain amino acid transport system ATP-binding protein|nr:ABC transporter ATP-binding protein [Erysipelothrix sp.]